MKAIRRKDWQPAPGSKVCSAHFRDEDFDRTSLAIVGLRENVVPSIFPAFPKYLKQKVSLFSAEYYISIIIFIQW